mgnify:CR=1 FL=1
MKSKTFWYLGSIFVGLFAGGGPITALLFFLIVRYMIKKGWITTSTKKDRDDQVDIEHAMDGYYVSIFYIAEKLGIDLDEVEEFIIDNTSRQLGRKNKKFAEHISFLRDERSSIDQYLVEIEDDGEEILRSLTDIFYPALKNEALREILNLAKTINKDDYYKKFIKELTKENEETGISEYFKILGCNEAASEEEIKRCYKRKISEFHPDKLEGKNLPASFIEFANEQSAKINAAYEAIRKYKGL